MPAVENESVVGSSCGRFLCSGSTEVFQMPPIAHESSLIRVLLGNSYSMRNGRFARQVTILAICWTR
jgi:hypothetical protein